LSVIKASHRKLETIQVMDKVKLIDEVIDRLETKLAETLIE
jgi:hypothetical protein